jgi:hypothetical protein
MNLRILKSSCNKEAKWYAEKDFASLLHEDLRIRKFIDNELKEASVSHVGYLIYYEVFQFLNRLYQLPYQVYQCGLRC